MTEIHPTKILTTEPSEELGRQIMALRYDKLLLVLKGMQEEAYRQAVADHERGRRKLSRHLSLAEFDLAQVVGDVSNIVEICKPYIDREIELERS